MFREIVWKKYFTVYPRLNKYDPGGLQHHFFELLQNLWINNLQARRNRGSWGGGELEPPQIFAKFDLLPIDNYSKKKKVAKNI